MVYTTYKHGDDWGMVFRILLPTYFFRQKRHINLMCHPVATSKRQWSPASFLPANGWPTATASVPGWSQLSLSFPTAGFLKWKWCRGRCLKDPRNLGLWLFSEWNTFSTFSTFQWFQWFRWFQFVLGCNSPSSSESFGFRGQFRHPWQRRSRLFLITLRCIIFLSPAQIIFPHFWCLFCCDLLCICNLPNNSPSWISCGPCGPVPKFLDDLGWLDDCHILRSPCLRSSRLLLSLPGPTKIQELR